MTRHKGVPPQVLRIILSASLLLLLAPAVAAQDTLDEAAAKRLRQQAGECSRAFVEGDYERLADCTHTKVVELMGGREKMVESVRGEVAEMKADGFEPLTYETGEPSQVLRVGSATYAVVPAKLRLRTKGTVYVSDSFMVGVSADGGKSWRFVSGAGADPVRLKLLLPDAADKLKLPTVRNYPEAEKKP